MNITCSTCKAVFNNPREVAMPLPELEGVARLTGWLVGETAAECPACLGPVMNAVDESFLTSKEAASHAR